MFAWAPAVSHNFAAFLKVMSHLLYAPSLSIKSCWLYLMYLPHPSTQSHIQMAAFQKQRFIVLLHFQNAKCKLFTVYMEKVLILTVGPL